jgi:hypothetical protein
MTALKEPVMPRKPKRDDTAVKVENAIYRQARQVAAHRGIPIAQYLSELLRGPVAEDYRRMVTEMAQETRGGKGGGK